MPATKIDALIEKLDKLILQHKNNQELDAIIQDEILLKNKVFLQEHINLKGNDGYPILIKLSILLIFHKVPEKMGIKVLEKLFDLCQDVPKNKAIQIDIKDEWGRPAFMTVCALSPFEKLEMAQYLFSKGANPSECDQNFRSAIHFACAYRNESMVLWLVNVLRININTPDEKYGNTPMMDAIVGKHLAWNTALGDEDDEDPGNLIIANKCKEIQLNGFLNFLKGLGSDIKLKNKADMCPIMKACEYGEKEAVVHMLTNMVTKEEKREKLGDIFLHSAMHDMLSDNIVASLTEVMKSSNDGFNPFEAKDKIGRNALSIACKYKSKKFIHYLFNCTLSFLKEIKVPKLDDLGNELGDELGNTPFHYLVEKDPYQTELLDEVDLLISNGFSLKTKNKEGKTPLFYVGSRPMVERLMPHKPNLYDLDNTKLSVMAHFFLSKNELMARLMREFIIREKLKEKPDTKVIDIFKFINEIYLRKEKQGANCSEFTKNKRHLDANASKIASVKLLEHDVILEPKLFAQVLQSLAINPECSAILESKGISGEKVLKGIMALVLNINPSNSILELLQYDSIKLEVERLRSEMRLSSMQAKNQALNPSLPKELKIIQFSRSDGAGILFKAHYRDDIIARINVAINDYQGAAYTYTSPPPPAASPKFKDLNHIVVPPELNPPQFSPSPSAVAAIAPANDSDSYTPSDSAATPAFKDYHTETELNSPQLSPSPSTVAAIAPANDSDSYTPSDSAANPACKDYHIEAKPHFPQSSSLLSVATIAPAPAPMLYMAANLNPRLPAPGVAQTLENIARQNLNRANIGNFTA